MNKLSVSYEDSLLNKIPEDWEVMTLNNVLKIVRGFAFESGDYLDDGILNFRVTNVGHLANDIGSVEYLPNNFFNRFPSQQLKGGEIVIVMVGATTGKLGRVPSDICPALMNQNLWKLIAKDIIITDFLWYLLPSTVNRHMQLSQGSARDFLKQSEFIKTLVAGPFKNQYEQAKIAEVLSTVDKAISETEALIAKQQRIKTGLMQDLLTRGIDENGNLRSEETHQFKDSPLGRIPIEWGIQSLDSLINIIDCKHYTPIYVSEGIPIIRPRNIKISGFDLSDLDFVSEKDYKLLTDKHKPSKNDIVFSRNASFGIPVYVENIGRFCIGQDVVVMTYKKVNTRFIFYALKSEKLVEQIAIVSAGSTFGRIDLKSIRNLIISYPTCELEQKKIATKINQSDKLIKDIKYEHIKLLSLKTALMQDLLTGKKRVTPLLENDPIY